MVETADFVVVGGGCMGTSIALHLARRNMGRVMLLERHTLASGATGKSTANIRQHYSHPTLARMAKRSLERFRHFADLYGGDAGFVPCGYTNGVGAEDRAALEAIVAMNRGVGINAQVLEPADLKGLFPHMNLAGVAAGMHEPDSGYADPAGTTMAFGAAARRAGAMVREGVGVTGFRLDPGRVTGVRTSAGDIAAGTVVLATNGWTVGLCRTLGIEVPMVNERHDVVVIERPTSFPGTHPIFGDFVAASYFRAESGNLTLVGSNEHHPDKRVDPDRVPTEPGERSVQWSAERAALRFPCLEQGRVRRGWSSFYDCPPDLQFILDRAPGIRGLWLACGFAGHGFKHSPIVGELMAGLILDGRSPEPDLDLSLFAFDRFAAKRYYTPLFRYSTVTLGR
jgi:glycine/D-amino acid oxidase-like deaminating enzyme